MNCQRRSLMQLGVWPLEGVSVTLLIPTHLVMRSRIRSEATESLRYLMVACVQVPVKKFPECLPTACHYLIQLFFPHLCMCVGVLACWCVGVLVCVYWGLPLAHDQGGTNFAPCDVCGGPLLCPPSTSARVQSRYGFVELGRDMSCNCTGEVQAGTGISGWYQLSSYHALCKYENIGYLEVPDDHLYIQYVWIWIYECCFCFFAVIQLFIVHPPRELV